jgi:chemotaxis protein methyltransferase CheR
MGRVLAPDIEDPHRTREFVFTARDFQVLRKLVNQYTGISLSDAKRELVYNRLSRRLRYHKIKSFRHYCDLLQSDSDGQEIIHFTNAITTNLTAFFRESHHFDFLKTNILGSYVKNGGNASRIRLWSAGCSTGEEPYSIAMTIKGRGDIADDADIRILATDLDSTVLETAKKAAYPQEKLKCIPPHQAKRWFLKGSERNTGLVQVKPAVRSLVAFRRLNLLDDWPMRGPFDAIFCRNVVIYFDKATQQQLVDRFADMLVDGGFLFLGHSESLFKVSERFCLVGQTIYQKTK